MQMKQELISVIVPVYNVREYLTRCVRSLQAQTYENLEILLVDDGSTDGSGELCDVLAGEDGRIRVFHKQNGGSSSARNLGICRATGAYLGFVDSDDYVDEDMYERLYQGICTYQTMAAQIGRDEITPKGEVLPDICIPPKKPERITASDFLRELLMHRGDCSFCTKLFRREVFQRESFPVMEIPGVGEVPEFFPDGLLNEDFRLLILLLPGLGEIVSLPGHAYHVFYRVGSNSRKESRELFSRVFGDCVDNADLVAEIVEKQYPVLRDVAFRFGVFQRLEYLLHIPVSRMTADNRQYREIVGFLRHNLIRGWKNPYLTRKNKLYHTLFAIAPKNLRRVHRLTMKLRGIS